MLCSIRKAIENGLPVTRYEWKDISWWRPVTKDRKKANTLNAPFISLFTGKTIPHLFQVPENHKKAWSKADFLSMQEDQVRKHLNKLDTHRSMGHNEMHHTYWRLADVIVRALNHWKIKKDNRDQGKGKKLWGLEENKYHLYFQEIQSQPHLNS